MNRKLFLSEFLSTFFLVFAGTGSVIVNIETNGALSQVGVALTFGTVVTAMIYAFRNYSGAHMNPAVTIALLVGKKIEIQKALLYILAQLVGAFFASTLLHLLFPQNAQLGATIPSGSYFQSFILEFILTFFLMITILTTANEKNNFAPVAIGFVVLLEALFAGLISGASMNPFRSLAPAVIGGNLESVWIYITAPIFGASIAMSTYLFLEK